MVTGADSPVGRHAVRLLASQGGEVRVFVEVTTDDPSVGESLVAAYRDLGCKVAHGFLDDEAHVETALEQVHTVLHLLGRPTDDPDAYLERTATVVSATIGASCRRLVLLSDLAVADPGGNPWLQALAEAEGMAEDAPLESVVLRCAAIHAADDPLTVALAAGGLGPSPAGSHWPVAAVDVATTAVLADAERELDTGLHVVVSLAGPQQLGTAAYVQALAEALAKGLPVGAVTGGRAPLPEPARELMSRQVDRPEDGLGSRGRAVADGLG
jgi:nucleoside-diphosphate-sugar epimerase